MRRASASTTRRTGTGLLDRPSEPSSPILAGRSPGGSPVLRLLAKAPIETRSFPVCTEVLSETFYLATRGVPLVVPEKPGHDLVANVLPRVFGPGGQRAILSFGKGCQGIKERIHTPRVALPGHKLDHVPHYVRLSVGKE